MNCGEFEIIIADLAGEKVMEAASYKLALAHKNSCARCAARLAQERSLTKALAIVANAETEQAPAHTKAALLQAFVERMPQSAAPFISSAAEPAATGKVLAFTTRTRKPVAGWMWAVAAAVTLAMVSAAAMRLLNPSSVQPGTRAFGMERIEVEKFAKSKRTIPQSPTAEKDNLATGAIASVPKPSQKRISQRQKTVTPSGESQQLAEANETTTDYIPLTYVAEATAMESGQVVRVMMSRSSLLALGLPVNLERDDEKIKADLVVGDDGLARAIRFVYPAKK